jgi:hypothetical protein
MDEINGSLPPPLSNDEYLTFKKEKFVYAVVSVHVYVGEDEELYRSLSCSSFVDV